MTSMTMDKLTNNNKTLPIKTIFHKTRTLPGSNLNPWGTACPLART